LLTEDYDPLKGRMLQVLDKDGDVNADLEPKLDEKVLKEAYRTMVLARLVDEKAVILQRQGRMGAYAPNRGQEAAQLGPALAMEKDDWLVWAFRELSALLWRGVPLLNYYLYWMGNEEGNHFPPAVKVAPTAVPVASQLPYAVGIAYASMYRKENTVTLAFCGDGATSEGDFHEALNFAGVFGTPTVFIIQNNQWAISMPRKRQSAAQTLAQKAVGYGIPGIQVDGNDILGMYIAAKEAIDRARSGGGSTLIEAYTYRLGDHTTSDDAKKYRQELELKEWEGRDPLIRFKAYLKNKNILDERIEKGIWDEMKGRVEKAVEESEAFPPPTLEDVFKYNYGEMTGELRDQLEFLRKELKGGEK
jgi:pyruvate dehydrogenase E1 component alpha subunit